MQKSNNNTICMFSWNVLPTINHEFDLHCFKKPFFIMFAVHGNHIRWLWLKGTKPSTKIMKGGLRRGMGFKPGKLGHFNHTHKCKAVENNFSEMEAYISISQRLIWKNLNTRFFHHLRFFGDDFFEMLKDYLQ